MKYTLITIVLLATNSLFAQKKAIKYDINVNHNLDTFYVDVKIPQKLSKSNSIYQFPSTAPGTYQTMNIGRLVSNFKAFDKKGRELKYKYNSPNQFIIKKPKKVRTLSYKVAETFDTDLKDLPIYLMAGSSIEKDHTLINAHTLAGYFTGKQDYPVAIKLIGQSEWLIGSALKEVNGYYLVENFDKLVDSPLLAGKLTYAETKIANTPIKIYTYSEKGKINSEMLLKEMESMLKSAEKFLIELPVDHYTFLFYFLQEPTGITGAWEHSYSSEYVLKEGEPTENFLSSVVDIASHEFFHIVTPLNIHSEIIEHFNFEKPTPSQHLWLYEGVTEWASHIQLFRGGVNNLEKYIANGLKQKILVDELYFKPEWSLKQIADQSFDGGEGSKQYGNVYYKGALTASYLDILLLDLSNGQKGLREILLELVKKYGKGNPISEETFFDDLSKMTYPEVKDFASKYILGNEKFDHANFLSKIGLNYDRKSKQEIEIIKLEHPTERQARLFEIWSKNK